MIPPVHPSVTLAEILDALGREAPEPVARGRAALGRVLGWTVTTKWPEVAWSFSDLASGSPVELVWRPGRPGLFWTAEPAAPEWSAARRLNRALALLSTLGARFGLAQRNRIRQALAGSSALWPVWVGGRHDAQGDAFKLYALSDQGLHAGFRADDCTVMSGMTADGGLECYWRRRMRDPGDRWRLMRDPGMRAMVETLERALRDWTGHGLDAASGGGLGLSLKRSAAGAPECLAAFLRVRQAGGDEPVRRRLMEAGGEANPSLGRWWAAGRLRPMFLTLAASADGVAPAIGLRMVA